MAQSAEEAAIRANYRKLMQEHGKLVIKNANLRNHVRIFLDSDLREEALLDWRLECERLFERYHWFDPQGRNIIKEAA